MCILIVKPCGAQFPAEDAIITSVRNNPDGFSLAYSEGGKLVTRRSMDPARFVSLYRKLVATLDPEDTAMILHARIATHGAVGLRNCHCWKSFAGTDAEMAFAHNGILSVPARDGMTDSETFLRDYYEPSYLRGGWAAATDVIRRKIGTSKFAFIDRSGDVRTFGHFINEGGCLYSNSSYQNSRFARFADPRNWDKPLAI